MVSLRGLEVSVTPHLLIGTSLSGRGGDTGRREHAAQASLAALAAGRSVSCVNLAFVDEPTVAGRVPSINVLQRDARSVSGGAGPRQPIVSDMFTALADEAARHGIPRIALVNGDIVVTGQAVERCLRPSHPAVAIGRTDVGGGRPDAELLHGVDMFAFEVEFWRRERHRFRAYVLGEAVWDNVYAAIAIAHGGILINRERLILHERHAPAARHPRYERYIHLLAARDSSYFKLWCEYVAQAQALRARGGSVEEEYAPQRRIFHPPGRAAAAAGVARVAWWRAKRVFGA